MKIFVINLPKSADRRENVNQQMQAYGVEFEFFAAINGEQAMADWFKGYDEREFLLNTGRRSSQGEKGCYASHVALWQRCVELGEPIMIMEDDLSLTEHFPAAFALTKTLIEEYGSIRLQEAPPRSETKVAEFGEFGLYRYLRMPHCTMCYALTPAVAQAFLDHSAIVREPVDVFMKKFWQHKQPMYCLMPYTVVASEHGDDSTVQNRGKVAKPLDVKLQRPLRKVRWGLSRWLANAKFAALGRY